MKVTFESFKFIGSLLCHKDESRVIGEFHADRRLSKAEREKVRNLIIAAPDLEKALKLHLKFMESLPES